MLEFDFANLLTSKSQPSFLEDFWSKGLQGPTVTHRIDLFLVQGELRPLITPTSVDLFLAKISFPAIELVIS